MLTITPHFISTYAKSLVADWSVIHNFIKEDTIWIKDRLHSNSASILTTKQINDALNGPFQTFFRTHLKAYALISKIETALNFLKKIHLKKLKMWLPFCLMCRNIYSIQWNMQHCTNYVKN